MSSPLSRSAATRPQLTGSASSGTVLRVDGPLGAFASTLLAIELPRLPNDSQVATVAFVCRRAQQIPGPLRLGVTVLTFAAGSAARVLGWQRVTGFVRHTRIPVVGELARLVRSLGFAYVWETWPSTTPDGAPLLDSVVTSVSATVIPAPEIAAS